MKKMAMRFAIRQEDVGNEKLNAVGSEKGPFNTEGRDYLFCSNCNAEYSTKLNQTPEILDRLK